MRPFLVFLSFFALCGCTATQMALYSGNPDTAIDLMSGQGSLTQQPDGTIGFRYLIPKDAYKGFVASDHESLRIDALGRWLGSEQACSEGYKIDRRIENTSPINVIIYEGHCK